MEISEILLKGNLFETHKHSPYRNYIRASFRHHDKEEKVLYLTVLAENKKIHALEERLRSEIGESARITVSDSEYEGFLYLKVFSPFASKHEMMKKLKEHTGAERIITFGSIKGEYDVYIGDGGGNATIKELKKLYRYDVFH